MRYRAAVIGCGRIGSEFADDPRVKGIYTHAGAYAACADTALVAVCDTDPERARRCAERWSGAAAYSDVRSLMAEARPEIVSVCTPDATHQAVLAEVLGADGVRAVLAEKPLALRPEDAMGVVESARRRGVVLAVNYSRRYSRRLDEVRDAVRSGRLGTIQKVAGLYTKGVTHNGSHWFDLLRFLVGEVRAVRGFANGKSDSDDPTLDAWLRLDDGATAFLQGCSADAYAVFEMDIVGTLGRVRIVDSGHRIETSHVAPSPRYTGYSALHESAPVEGDLDETMPRAVEDLVASLRDGREPRCRGEDGVAALRVASALIESAAHGREVSLEAP